MLPASTHMALLMGVDIHTVQVPTPAGPVPTPLPHPFVGMVMDPADYFPFIGATVFINFIPRGCSFTEGMLGTKRHIATPPGIPESFIAPKGDNSFNFFGSLKVKAEGNLLAAAPFSVMSCNDFGVPLTLSVPPGKSYKPIPSLYLPLTMSVPLPPIKPVLVGGPYVPDLMGMLMSLVMSYGFGAALKAFGRVLNAALKKLDLNCTKGLQDFLCKKFGEPVDMVTGRVIYEITDFEIPGPLPVKWERRWYSDSGYQGMLGHGYHLNYDLTLITNYNESAIGLILPDGRATAFPLLLNKEESFYNRPEKLTLTNKGDHFELKDHAKQHTYIFSKVGKDLYKPASLSNLSGFRIQFRYDSAGKLAGLIDSVGRNIVVSYDESGRAAEVTVHYKDFKRKLVRYGYNDNNDLAEITDALGKTTRIRYANHLMVEKTDRDGHTFYWEYEGHGTEAKCVHTWGDGGLLEGWIKYGKEFNTVTNSLGETTKYYYNELNLCTKITDPLGNSIEYLYTDDMELYREIDEEGNITGYSYDKRGNLTAKHFPDNTTVTFMYNEDDMLVLKMDAQNQATVYNYSKDKLLNTISSPDGNILALEYDSHKQLAVIKDGKTLVTTLSYDEDYNLSEMIQPGGAVTKWNYDIWGRCKEIINPENKSQFFRYDELNRIVSVKRFDNNTVKLKYNAYEDVVLAEDEQRKIEFTYNALGSILTRDESGTRIRFTYDSQNRMRSIKNENDEVYSFGRDGSGRIKTEIGFDGLTRHYERDRSGKIIRIQRPGNKWTECEYDLQGRLVSAQHNDGTWEVFSYNRNGQLIEAGNENSTVQILCDKVGRVVKEVCGEHWVESTYGETGKRVKVSTNLGANINHEFNEAGNLSKMQAKVKDSLIWDATFKYNVLGLEQERLVTGGVKNSFEYDAAGRPVRQTTSSAGRETLHRSYSWDVNNRLTKMVNELSGGSVLYGHDDFGNLAWAQYENGSFDYRMPDTVGNLYKTKERSDSKYGPGGKLLESDGAIFEYDDEGNLISKTEKEGGNWRYEWKGNGMLQEVTRPDGKKVTFEYDALGRRLSKTYNKTIIRWLWNGNVPLHEWQYREEEKPKPVVNEFGEINKDKPEPVNNLLTWIFDEGTFRPAAKIDGETVNTIITDYLGTPAEMYNAAGEKTWQADYDIRGKIRKQTLGSPADCPFRYQGQYEDVETGLCYNRFRYYDSSVGVYIAQDPIGIGSNNPNLYSFVVDPNISIDIFGLEIVYRLLRPEENPANGLTAKKPDRGMTLHGHVSSGSRNKGSQYISTSKDPTYLVDTWHEPGQRLVAIDTDKLGPGVQVIDISTKEMAMAAGVGEGSANLPAKSKEVLLVGHVPPDAIEEVDPKQFKTKCS